MGILTAIEYSGIEDLKRMQDLVSSTFNIKSHWHIGDLSWQRFQHENVEQQWQTCLFEENNKTVAWGWLEPNGVLNLMIHPDNLEHTSAVLDHFSELNKNEKLTVIMMESENGLISELLKYGFKESQDKHFNLRMHRELEDLPDVILPEGFTGRHVDPSIDLKKRVDVHRKAWEPSKVTYESYGNVMRSSGYSPNLDWVIVGPDGTFVSSCLIWYDKLTHIGLLEPTGTSPEYRRMGLSRAVCIMALMELRKTGGKGAIVHARGDEDYPIPFKLYSSVGFNPITRERTFVKWN